MKKNRYKKFYNKLVVTTICAVYLLILAGGIVRSTGSGMGCPDWPKCFGSWIPPTSVAQLPVNYQELYAQQRVEKNHRLAGYAENLGFTSLAQELRAETLAAPEAAFNPTKTWIEYVNRLLGVVIGILIAGVAAAGLSFIKVDPAMFIGSIAALLLVVFQGWIGSVVVSTNLLPGMVTFHMVLALLLIGLLIFLAFRSQPAKTLKLDGVKIRTLKSLLVISIAAVFIQVALGTQVREAIDSIALQFDYLFREQWVSGLGTSFYFHRSFSLIILGLHVYLYLLCAQTGNPLFRKWSKILLGLIVLEIAIGAYMVYFGIPAWAQPLHLLSSVLIVGLQFWLYLQLTQKQVP